MLRPDFAGKLYAEAVSGPRQLKLFEDFEAFRPLPRRRALRPMHALSGAKWYALRDRILRGHQARGLFELRDGGLDRKFGLLGIDRLPSRHAGDLQEVGTLEPGDAARSRSMRAPFLHLQRHDLVHQDLGSN